jgi:hypothetical protein
VRPTVMRARRLIALVLLVPFVLTGCGAAADPQPSPGETARWQRLPDVPLSPRGGPVTVWTGSEVLVIGGETGDICPPNADCAFANESASDGAALDPDRATWRPIAVAPVPVPGYSAQALVGGHLFVRVDHRLLDYDIDGDRWQVLPRRLSEWYDLEADGDRLVLTSGSDETGVLPDLVYDPRSATWSQLPRDPLGPMYGRGIVATPAGLLLVGLPLVENPGGGDRPSYVRGALLDRRSGTWSKLPKSDQLGGGYWGAIGSRVVNLSLDSSNGGGDGAGDYGRQIPFGGVLDLQSKTWGRLPHPPKYLTGGWTVGAVGTRLIAAEGWLYDDRIGSWSKLPRPDGAAVQPGPAVWIESDSSGTSGAGGGVGDRLLVVGGSNQTFDAKTDRDGSVWVWRPEVGARL